MKQHWDVWPERQPAEAKMRQMTATFGVAVALLYCERRFLAACRAAGREVADASRAG